MSRTDKDRPYWVRANDHTEARFEHHDHLKFGYEYEYVNTRGKRVEVKYADYCTVNEPEVRYNHHEELDRPCGKWVGHGYFFGRYSPKKKDRKVYYWGPMRAARTRYLTNAVKDFNSFGEVDEEFYFQEDARYGRYGGGYWD